MVTIIGAGISGLSLAYFLQKSGIEYILLESSSEPGGYIKSVNENNCVLELGPNSILVDEKLLSFFKELGLEKELLPANDVSKARFIFKNGSYKKLPDGPAQLLFGDFFSLSTKLKVLKEPFTSPVEKNEETLEEFFNRRFGQEICDYALNPFITGIYAGDPKELLLEETFPILKDYERNFGSVLKGFIKNKPKRKQTYNFINGMQTLPKVLAQKVTNLKYNTKLLSIEKNNELGISLLIDSNGITKSVNSSFLVITTPSFTIEEAFKNSYPEFSKDLKNIYYPPICAVHTLYDKSKVGHSLNGFGGLNPKVENQFTSGSIWSSSIFSGRCPEDKVLFTSFVGGTLNAEKSQLSDIIIKEKVHKELSVNFNISAPPVFQKLTKWDKAIPQYTKELKRVKKHIPELEKDNIFFSVNWINGVSLPDCIKKSKLLTDKIKQMKAS